MTHCSGGSGRPFRTLARLGCAFAALAAICCASWRGLAASRPEELLLRAPDLTGPLAEVFPAVSRPEEPVKKLIFARINRDRAVERLFPVAWDEAASRVADEFCAQQVREASRGHFLMDGIPPYARTGFAGVFGVQAENSASWITTGGSFLESPARLALTGHEEMMAEKPPQDGHRRTILDPEATHVGVGYAAQGGRFQMAQEFLVRGLERLSLARRPRRPTTLRIEGKPLPDRRLEFVTIALEPAPVPLTREEATGRSSYAYPHAALAYVAEGRNLLRVSGVETKDRIRVWPNREFSFNFTPDRAGLYTLIFYTAVRSSEPPRPAAAATIWVER